ncbi:MAG: acyltransferase [Prevotellaceae bacterium]|jgi:peptidoglycan/LPS O-acetylase OafA/YrhL|nr:acyltransferase [Prevotellaceae bacterium]
MQKQIISTKPRYEILDGLRGVAAVMVVAFHIFEAHATSHFDQVINHGYLAVDFFFVLSGVVIGYAYDDRWSKGMSIGTFFKRRLIRLQPMVIFGSLIGAACFFFQDSPMFYKIHNTPVWLMLIVMVIGMTLIPLAPGKMDIRGWGEMHPLNGPAWSLFLEYCANILYALFIRKFSKTALSILVFIAGAVLIHFAVTSPHGDIIGGWSLNGEQLRIGFTRLIYPFFAGLLLYRICKTGKVKDAFLWCSLLIIIALSVPRIGGKEFLWANGIYDSLVIIFLFPFVVWLGASGEVTGKYASKICKFLGDISYPIYITHYPLIYIYTGWVGTPKMPVSDVGGWAAFTKPPISETWHWAVIVFISCILLAWASMKFYDLPVRKWLTKIWK